MAKAKRKRRPKCGFNKPGKPTKGRRANGTVKPGFRITKGGRVRPAKKRR